MNNVNNMNSMNNMNTQNSIQNQNLTPNPMTTPQIDNQNTMLQQNLDVQGPLPSNNSLEIVLPSEETQKQVNIVQKQAMFVTKNNEYVEEVKEVPHNETVVEVPNAIELNDNKNLQN